MKQFLLRVCLFMTIILIVDVLSGFLFSYLRIHAKGGSTANCEYIANGSSEEVIILGSSRATHHYIPAIISDSLGLSCYNCGEEGNGIVLAYGRYKMITSRYCPKLIIYEVSPEYDCLEAETNIKYLEYLKPYYKKEPIKAIVNDFGGEYISLKMFSNMYQNSSRLLPNVFDNIVFRDNMDGYSPLYGKISFLPKPIEKIDMSIDSKKLGYLESLIRDANDKNISICFVVSPQYCIEEFDEEKYDPIIQLCNAYNLPFLNYSSISGLSDNSSYFQDILHMNNDGAIVYTKLFVNMIKDYVNL